MSTTARKIRKNAARAARENLAQVNAEGFSKRTKVYRSAVQAVEDTRYVSTRGSRTRNSMRRRRRDFFDFPLVDSRPMPPQSAGDALDSLRYSLASSAHAKPTNVQRAARGK